MDERRTILIVDDEPVVQQAVELALEPLGCTMLSAGTIREALAQAQRTPVDVAIVDKNLPDGSGIDFVRELKRENPDAEALILTGYGSLESALDAIQTGVFDYLRKPFDVSNLVERVSAAVRATAERKRRQVRLQSVYRMEALGRLAASIGHEINNPLTYVLNNVEFIRTALESGAPSPEELVELLDAAEDAHVGASRIRSIVRDLTVLTRREHEERQESIDVRETVRSAVKVVSNQIRHNASLDIALGETPRVEGSDLRLFQVLINLLVNANQALPSDRPGNRILVTTATDSHGWACITIKDNGMGIEPDVMGQIFDRFFTTKSNDEGTGLGLNISKRYVESMGGRIEVESQPGNGAVFVIFLPPVAHDMVSVRPPRRSEAPTATRASVLLIDDDALVLKSAARSLGEHDLVCVSSGDAAIELLAERRGFDVILCDVMMPGVDGVDVYDYLATQDQKLADSIVFITGGAFTTRAQQFIESIENQVLEKPVSPLELDRLVRERARSRDPSR